MSRVPLAEGFFKNSNPPRFDRNVAVYVYKRGTQTQATLYSAEESGSKVAQPVFTDNLGRPRNGNAVIWIEEGEYDILVGGETIYWNTPGSGEGGGGEKGATGPTGPSGASGASGATGATGSTGTSEVTVVFYGEETSKARPVSYNYVIWVGKGTPTHATENDIVIAEDGLTVESDRTFAIDGTVTAHTGPGFFVRESANQKKKLVAIRCHLNSGTSCKISIKRTTSGGASEEPASFKEKEVKSAEVKEYTGELELNTNDLLTPVWASPSGTPIGASVTLFIKEERV